MVTPQSPGLNRLAVCLHRMEGNLGRCPPYEAVVVALGANGDDQLTRAGLMKCHSFMSESKYVILLYVFSYDF